MTAQEELDKALAAYDDGKTYSYKGKKYSLTKLRDELIPMLTELLTNKQVVLLHAQNPKRLKKKQLGKLKNKQNLLSIEQKHKK